MRGILIFPPKSKLIFWVLLRTINCFATESSLITIRIAKLDDVPSIKHCNRETLPENYDDGFLKTHILSWPTLALVAENKENGILGYCLGRVEVKYPAIGIRTESFTSSGHVTSLAVYPAYRNKRIAHRLMTKLHETMCDRYDVNEITLHCRPTNEAAIKLYKSFSYM